MDCKIITFVTSILVSGALCFFGEAFLVCILLSFTYSTFEVPDLTL
jgi:hypothetical protein